MFPRRIHRYIFLLGVYSMPLGMMLGAIPSSVPMFILGANWLLEADFKRKWNQLRSNKIFLLLVTFFLAHVAGLLYSADLNSGLNDIKIKLPLFALPLIFFGSDPLSKKELDLFFVFFILGVLINISWCLFYQFNFYHGEAIRNTSRFMSHIRLGLFLNFALVCCAQIFFCYPEKSVRYAMLLSALYISYSLFALALFSGVIIFFLLFMAGFIYWLLRQKPLNKIVFSILVAGIFIFLFWKFSSFVNDQLHAVNSEINTRRLKNNRGTGYTHYPDNRQMENGHYVFINLQPHELETEWNRKFPSDKINFEKSENLLRYEILIRYMASKGLLKDSSGLAQLRDEDFKNIRLGITNCKYPSWNPLEKRLYELINEYDEFAHHRTMNGHSVSLRFYYWSAAMTLIKKHILFGVGTGDVQAELNRVYSVSFKQLKPEWYKRPHNQFLSVALALGALGFIVFVAGLFYPIRFLRADLPWVYYFYFGILVLSFFWEDTLETQAGVAFYAVFNSVMLSVAWFGNKHQPDE